jgi:hypothetical protein
MKEKYLRHLARSNRLNALLGNEKYCDVVVGAVAAAGATVYASNQASDAASDATDAQSRAASASNAVSLQRLDFDKQVYNDTTKPLAQQDADLKKRIADDAMARAAKQDKFADSQNAYYEETFKPVEKKMVADADGYDSAANVAKRSGMAAANVNQQFSNAQGQKSRLMARYGINPSSSTAALSAGADSRAEALGAAGAATGAAFDTQDKAIALRAGAANFGRNMPNTASSYFAGANSSQATAADSLTSALKNTKDATGTLDRAYDARMAGITASAGLQVGGLNSLASSWGNTASNLGSAVGGLLNNKAVQSKITDWWGGLTAPSSWGGGSSAPYTSDLNTYAEMPTFA